MKIFNYKILNYKFVKDLPYPQITLEHYFFKIKLFTRVYNFRISEKINSSIGWKTVKVGRQPRNLHYWAINNSYNPEKVSKNIQKLLDEFLHEHDKTFYHDYICPLIWCNCREGKELRKKYYEPIPIKRE